MIISISGYSRFENGRFSNILLESNKFIPKYLEIMNVFLTFAPWKKKIFGR